MPRSSIALTEWGDAGKVTSSKSIFEKGDVLFGKLRPYFHKVGIAPVNGICSTDIVVIVPKAAEWSAFVLACVASTEFVSYTNQTSTGTKMPRTSWKIMSDYRMCLPTAPVVRAFQTVVHPVLGAHRRQHSQIPRPRHTSGCAVAEAGVGGVAGGKVSDPRAI